MNLALNKSSKLLLGLFFLLFIWWVYIALKGVSNTGQNYWYGVVEGLLPCIAAFCGFVNASRWGNFTSSMGKSVIFLSAGLFTWGVGTLIFAYYNIALQVAVPYPSFADALYIISWPLWAISMMYLSKATGAKFQLRNLYGRAMFFIIPIITAFGSYYVLIDVARQGTLGLTESWIADFFDLAYPIGDVVILTTALLIFGLSFRYLGGFFRWPILIILLGFTLNYVGDFSFVYLTTQGTYFVADWVDLVYTCAFFSLGLGVSLMDPHLYSRRQEKKSNSLFKS